MGAVFSAAKGADVGLYMDDTPSFCHTSGFCFKRKQRPMCARPEAMVSARIPLKHRDYCAHLLIDYQVCRYKHVPLMYRCAHAKHAYLECEHTDYVLRMMEYERERRLRMRENRIRKSTCKG